MGGNKESYVTIRKATITFFMFCGVAYCEVLKICLQMILQYQYIASIRVCYSYLARQELVSFVL